MRKIVALFVAVAPLLLASKAVAQCVPPCNSAAGEYCVFDVCYGSNGCPLHAHPVGYACACDAGWVPNGAGTACVSASSTDGGTGDVGGLDSWRRDVDHQDTTPVGGDARSDAAGGCGTLTYIGECLGDQVRYCVANVARTIDCIQRYEATATCGLLNCTDPGDPDCDGYWCVPRSGESCMGMLRSCDAATLQGCIGGVCTVSTTCDPGTFVPSCVGTAVTSCGYTVNVVDCAAGGRPFTCGQTSTGGSACLGQEGAACDVATGYECIATFTCVAGVCWAGARDGGSRDVNASVQDATRRDGNTAEPDAGHLDSSNVQRDAEMAVATDASVVDDEDSGQRDCACRAPLSRHGFAIVLLALVAVQRMRRWQHRR